MKLKEIITEANVAQQAGRAINIGGKAAGVAAGVGGGFGSNLIQGIKQGFGSKSSGKPLAPKPKKSAVDSVDQRQLKNALDKILTGQQLDSTELELLKDLKRKL